MSKLHKVSGLAAVVLLGLITLPTFGQAAGGGAADPNAAGGGRQRGQNGGGGGGRGNFDPAQFRQRMMDRLKDQLGTTDDEFKALEPKLEKVMDLQRDMTANRFGGRGGFGRGGPGGGGAGGGAAPAAGGGGGAPVDANPSPVAIKTRELQDLLEDKDAKPEEIKSKLDALRAEKAKAKDELVKAQADLRELLSQRQEAILVTNGMLD